MELWQKELRSKLMDTTKTDLISFLKKRRAGVNHMSEGFISRGFRSRRKPGDESGRLPPGQYLERGFPVLSAGPTPHTPLANWAFSLVGGVDQPKSRSLEEFQPLPRETVTKDHHTLTR